jgi:hypothetical protein
MNETNPRPDQKRTNPTGITLIVAITIVALACIAACTTTITIFILNAPW